MCQTQLFCLPLPRDPPGTLRILGGCIPEVSLNYRWPQPLKIQSEYSEVSTWASSSWAGLFVSLLFLRKPPTAGCRKAAQPSQLLSAWQSPPSWLPGSLQCFPHHFLEDGFSHFEAKVCSKRKLLHLFTCWIKTQKLQSWQLRLDHAWSLPLLSAAQETTAQKRV